MAWVTVVSLALPAYPADLIQVRDTAFSQPSLLQSYRFTATIREPDQTGVWHVTFYQDGDLLRSDATFSSTIPDSSGRQLTSVISAYNGDKYQTYYGHADILSYSSISRGGNPYSVPNPVLIPYLWLVADVASMNWSVVKDHSVWEKAFDQARYVGEDADAVVISVPCISPDSGMRAHVHFSRSLGYYPLSFTVRDPSGAELMAMVVREYRVFESDGGPLLFPLQIQEQHASVVVRDIEIAPDSIEINRPIDEDLFTLSLSMAKHVDDYDRNIMNRPERQSESMPLSAAPARRMNWRSVLLVVNACVLIAVAVAIVARRFIRR